MMTAVANPLANFAQDEPLIQIDRLSKVYGHGATAVRALDQISLTIGRGELVAIMGPSGCGKSTLLNMIGALDQPTDGEVWVAGENLAHLKNVDHFRARSVGFVFQLHNLLPTLNAVENVEIPMQGQGASKRAQRERAMHLLGRVELGDRARALPSQLSGGQQQRVAIARALANNPPLLLADEPTGALDSQSGEALLTLLGELNRDQGTTVIIVTHDRRVAQATNRIVRMRDGRIEEDHRMTDPIEEDLRTLADSRLGQAMLDETDRPLPQITAEEEVVLRRILLRVKGSQDAPQATLPTAPQRYT